MLLANFNRKEHLRHRAVSLRQHGFLVNITLTLRTEHQTECSDVKNYKWRLNLVWHRMLYSSKHTATVGVKGLIYKHRLASSATKVQNVSLVLLVLSLLSNMQKSQILKAELASIIWNSNARMYLWVGMTVALIPCTTQWSICAALQLHADDVLLKKKITENEIMWHNRKWQ